MEQGSREPPLKEGPIKAQSRDIKEVQVRPNSLQGSRSELLPNTVGLRTESESKSLFSEGVFDISESGDATSTEGGGNDLVQEIVATVQADITTVMETKFCGSDSSLMPTSKLVEVSNFTTTMESPKSEPFINESNPFNAPLILVMEAKHDTLVAKISNIEEALITHDSSPIFDPINSNSQQSQRQVLNMVNIPNKEKISITAMKGNELDQSNQPPYHAI
nr:hypothetical protein CFP56_40910 [Quercus suber]